MFRVLSFVDFYSVFCTTEISDELQVKQLMEESVTRKFVHEESSTITSLCSN